LPGAKHIEVTQANGDEAVAAGKHVGIQLVNVFGHGVGAQGFANVFFHLGQGRVVAIGAAAASAGKAVHLRVTHGHQHFQKATDVNGVGCERVEQAARDAAEGGLVEHMLHAMAGALAIFRVANVAFD
jgi:hypothetical protein